MSLVDRLKRAILSVLGIDREDRLRESTTSNDPGEFTSTDAATDGLDLESGTIESDDAEDGGRTTIDSEGGTQIGEEPDGKAESESALTEPESESKPPEEEMPVEADEPRTEETSEGEGDEEPGIDLEKKEAAPGPEDEAADTSEVEGPRTEEKSEESETGELEVEPDTGEQEAESVAEESGSETAEPDTDFEFEDRVGESESAEPDQESESAVEESESEVAESGSLETESESGDPEGSIHEDGSNVKESLPDKPETTTEPDDEEVEIPETDEAEEELESSLEEGESKNTEASESIERETDSIDAAGAEAEDGSASEGTNIEIFDEEVEAVEPDSGGQKPDSTIEPEPDDLPVEGSKTNKESSTGTPTSERQIPFALDPEENEVHVDDAEEGNPYICPECEGPLELRTSDKIRNYFAHEWGWLDEHECSLGSSSTSSEGEDVESEPDETRRQLPIYFGHSTRSVLRLFGEIPALKVDDFDDPENIPAKLERIEVDTQGTQDQPGSDWFSPANSQVDVGLVPDADEYQITVQTDGRFESIEGEWYGNGLEAGDVFVGEKAQAERMKTESPVVKEGQWVYVVLDNPPETVPGVAEIYHAGSKDILGVEVNDDTLGLLQQYADVQPSEEASFGAAVSLPPDVDPRSETVHGPPGTEVLIGIQPTGESDPVFQIVVPGNKERNTVIDAVGEGTPRFYATEIPQDGSDRHDIHGLGERESIEITAQDEQDEAERPWTEDQVIGVHVGDGDGDTQLLNPIRGPSSYTFGPDIDADAITDSIVFEGPDGYRFNLKAEFPNDVNFASVLRRSEVTAEEAKTAISNWIREGCDHIEIDFDAAGKTELVFDRELDCRVVLEAAVTIYDVEEEEDAINIAVPKVGRMLNPDLSYVEINAPDVTCPHCGEEHRPAFVAADTALIRLELNMDVRGVENSIHAERIAKAEIGKRIQGIPLKTVEVERL